MATVVGGHRSLSGFLITTLVLALAPLAQADYRAHPETQSFIDSMVQEQGFERTELMQLFAQVERQESILEAIARPAEKTKSWREYRPIFVVPLRISRGVEFWLKHRETLARAEQIYGVPAEIIVSIIGVETNYGRNMGSHRVLDALATLAFDYPPRAPFFRSELGHYLQLTRAQQQDPLRVKGSYAGAMGYGQFMPSSYRNYAVDFDGDGHVNIWTNVEDAIGSVANYFKAHGWRSGEPVAVRARAGAELAPELLNLIDKPQTSLSQWQARGLMPILTLPENWPAQAYRLEGDFGEEFWLGLHNFYVITRYNRSHMYALAVYQLSGELRAAMESKE